MQNETAIETAPAGTAGEAPPAARARRVRAATERPATKEYAQAMPTNTITKACDVCGQVAPHTQTTPNHILHPLLSLITFGFWIIVWLFVALVGTGKPVCQNCRAKAMNPGGASETKKDMCVVCLRTTDHVMTAIGKMACQECLARVAR